MTGYVKVEFVGGISTEFAAPFETAAAFWNNVITSGAPTHTFKRRVDLSKLSCDVDKVYEKGEQLEGLTIFSQVSPIDGVGQILGQAGPCMFNNLFPLFGIMKFDSADSQQLLDDGQFEEVVIHEMGHVVGIGAMWSAFALVEDPCPLIGTSCEGRRPIYLGANGIEGYELLGGTGDLQVSDERGTGTWNAHWDEDFFQNELMTGFLNQDSANPLSILTIKSLIDLGYSVDESAQEAYEIPAQVREGEDATTNTIELTGDILVFDAQEISEVEALIADDESSSSMKSEFAAIILLMIAGFAMLSALVMYQAKKQKQMMERYVNGAARTPMTKTANPMHQLELGTCDN